MMMTIFLFMIGILLMTYAGFLWWAADVQLKTAPLRALDFSFNLNPFKKRKVPKYDPKAEMKEWQSNMIQSAISGFSGLAMIVYALFRTIN